MTGSPAMRTAIRGNTWEREQAARKYRAEEQVKKYGHDITPWEVEITHKHKYLEKATCRLCSQQIRVSPNRVSGKAFYNPCPGAPKKPNRKSLGKRAVNTNLDIIALLSENSPISARALVSQSGKTYSRVLQALHWAMTEGLIAIHTDGRQRFYELLPVEVKQVAHPEVTSQPEVLTTKEKITKAIELLSNISFSELGSSMNHAGVAYTNLLLVKNELDSRK